MPQADGSIPLRWLNGAEAGPTVPAIDVVEGGPGPDREDAGPVTGPTQGEVHFGHFIQEKWYVVLMLVSVESIAIRLVVVAVFEVPALTRNSVLMLK